PHVHHHLGHPGVEQCLYDAIYERKHISELIHEHKGLQIVPALTDVERLKRPDYDGLKYALADLNGYTDTVVIDGAPGFNREAVVPLEVADEVIVVCNPEPPSLHEASKVEEVARELGQQVLGVVVNKTERGETLSEEHIEDELGLPVLG
ncbi:MAG: MinD/ParA family protein, partial [Halobacteriaceae archaeon]